MFYPLNFIWICPVVLNQLYVCVKVSVHKPEKEKRFYLNYTILKTPSATVENLLGFEIFKTRNNNVAVSFTRKKNRISESIF